MFCKFDRDTWQLKWNDLLINEVLNKIINELKNAKSDHEIYGKEIIEFECDILKEKG